MVTGSGHGIRSWDQVMRSGHGVRCAYIVHFMSTVITTAPPQSISYYILEVGDPWPRKGSRVQGRKKLESRGEASCVNIDQECMAFLEPRLALNPNPGVLLPIAGRETISLPCLMHHYDLTCFAFGFFGLKVILHKITISK